MPCYEGYYRPIRVCTDANVYGPKATTVDVSIEFADGHKWQGQYTGYVYLEKGGGGSYTVVKKHKISLQAALNTKISLSGVSAGSYRVTVWLVKDSNVNSTYDVSTPPFLVKR